MDSEYIEFELKKLEFEKSLELRNFEIDNFWKRGWFFGALLLAIATGYAQNKMIQQPLFSPVYLSFIAVLITLIQSLMNRGSKYWQERWEYKTKNKESALGIDVTKTEKFNKNEKCYIEYCIRYKNEFCLARGKRFSVTKLTFLVWDILFISSCFVWVCDICSIFSFCDIDCIFTIKIFMFHGVLIGYIILFISKGKVCENLEKSYKSDKFKLKDEYEQICNKYVNNHYCPIKM